MSRGKLMAVAVAAGALFAIRKAADAYLRARLTPTLKKLTSRWLAWTR